MQCGFSALVALNNRFDARTSGNLFNLVAVMGAMSSPTVKQAAGIPKAILDWEEKLNALGNIHNETISENIKMGILISMLPKEYQDLCFGIGGVSGAKPVYSDIRDKVVNMANHKITLCTPTPMDLDQLGQNDEWNVNGDANNYWRERG